MKKPKIFVRHNLLTGKTIYKLHFSILGLAFQIPVFYKTMKKQKGVLFK